MNPLNRHQCFVRPSVSPDDHTWDSQGVEKQKALTNQSFMLFVVPRKGLEPPHLAAPEPKSGASTNFATWASGRILPPRLP